jgi:hypothetical protein
MEAMLKFSMEPEVMDWLGYHTSEIKPVMTLEESMKLLKKAEPQLSLLFLCFFRGTKRKFTEPSYVSDI